MGVTQDFAKRAKLLLTLAKKKDTHVKACTDLRLLNALFQRKERTYKAAIRFFIRL
jgi:hypothetical protein